MLAHHLADTLTTYLAAGPTPASGGGATPAAVSSSGVSQWLKDNVVQLIILIIGIGLLGKSRKGDTSGTMLTVGLLVIALAVVAIGLSATTGINVGTWVLKLFGIG